MTTAAGCVLQPRRRLNRALGWGTQRGTSRQAIELFTCQHELLLCPAVGAWRHSCALDMPSWHVGHDRDLQPTNANSFWRQVPVVLENDQLRCCMRHPSERFAEQHSPASPAAALAPARGAPRRRPSPFRCPVQPLSNLPRHLTQAPSSGFYASALPAAAAAQRDSGRAFLKRRAKAHVSGIQIRGWLVQRPQMGKYRLGGRSAIIPPCARHVAFVISAAAANCLSPDVPKWRLAH